MHLRSIKLRGFKSFPDPVEVKLERGVAVVVGPNGSGKSNVSDAIVWAAGSLTPSELRADKPDDVLFNGSQKRQPADHCEVELLFDNTEGTFADLDFSEISIARRLVRGGEGQYLVNRTPVRRTDLTELLADVGLGKSMHSIVSQGKVGQVLASRPDERRELIEEAAGLGKFKQRKHRAELKLTRVGIQVDRAKDVEEEVKKRLRPLALQATAAERAEKLAVEIAGLRLRVAQLDLASVAERKAAADERKQAATMARRSAHEKLTGLLAEREQAEEELSDAAGKREAALGALYRLQGAAERLVIRRESAAGLQARLAGELREVERELAERSDEAMRALEQASLSAAGAARDAAQASGQAAERARLAHAQVAAAERMIAQAAEARLEELRGERERVERALSEAVGGQEAANKRLRALGASRERLSARRENIGGLLGRLREELASARAIAARGGPSPAELEQAANDAAQLARATATERDDLAERARAARDRLAALERAIAEREGIPPAARALAAEGERLVLSALEVDPGNERAVTAALGWRASALLAADPEAGLALLRRAHDAGLGSLSVVAGRDPSELVAALPVVPLEALLDATTASVTAEGFGFDPDRGELWFAGETAEAVLLEMDARRRSLVDESEELTARAASAAKAAEDAAAQAKLAEAAFAEVAHLRDRFVDPDVLERLVAVAGTAEKMIERAASSVARIEGPIAAGVTAGSDASATLGPELRRLADLEGTARRDAADAARRAQTAEVVVARLGGAVEGVNVAPDVDLNALAAEASSLLAASEAAARAAREAADRARAAESMLLERAPRKVAADPDLLGRLVSFTGEVGGLLESAAVLADRLQAPVRARVDAGSQRSTELGATLRRLGAEEVQLRAAVDEATERVTKVEVEIARLDGEGAEAQRRLDEAGTEEPAEGDDRAELHARAERLEQRRQSLGMVNPLAKEEYEAEKVRLEELSAQREDLEASLRELEKLRDELAETVKRRFDDTFAAVAENFQEVAETLFPGGAGRLRLVESDEEGVEPGVEVELSPAGKKITKLSLLSGGEKALGAISFLFALFLAKPCPFYLLDEVEAALDDANVGRFVELLRRYADRAQFVVITHQKRTMEAADVLYGVTMGGDGVSQIVSRRLPRHESVVAGAAAS